MEFGKFFVLHVIFLKLLYGLILKFSNYLLVNYSIYIFYLHEYILSIEQFKFFFKFIENQFGDDTSLILIT